MLTTYMQINVNVNQLHVTTKEHMYFQFVFVISQAGKERENTVGSGISNNADALPLFVTSSNVVTQNPFPSLYVSH